MGLGNQVSQAATRTRASLEDSELLRDTQLIGYLGKHVVELASERPSDIDRVVLD